MHQSAGWGYEDIVTHAQEGLSPLGRWGLQRHPNPGGQTHRESPTAASCLLAGGEMFRGLGRSTPAVGALVFSPGGSWVPPGLSQLKPGSIPGSRSTVC